MRAPVEALLSDDASGRLRDALDGFTVADVHDLLGAAGRSALERGDLDGVEYALPAASTLGTLVRLFLLGEAVAVREADAALNPLRPGQARELLESDGETLRARVEIRPYGEDGSDQPWWVVSDFGSDVRPGPLEPDHVLGIGGASVTLAQATPRRPVGRSLDVGTGCGIQALHLSRHSASVTATDVSARALRLAATTAALSGTTWDLRHGSLLEPVEGERFDQVVANPPFVVSPGWDSTDGGFDYRDSGLAGDGVSEALLRGLPAVLAPGGTASLLLNWVLTADENWPDRVSGWLRGSGCDAWIWQREVAEPGEYVRLWLRDAGEQPGTERWRRRYRAWLDWFAQVGVLGVGMGLATLWRTESETPVVVCEDVRQAVAPPVGAALPGWIARQRWLRATGDADLLAACLRRGADVVLDRTDVADGNGWRTARTVLRQSGGVRWEIESDEAVAALVGACDAATPLAVPVAVLAAELGVDSAEVSAALLPVVRDLVGRGVLEPADLHQ